MQKKIKLYLCIYNYSWKCKLQGVNIKLVEESYTSKCSFIDTESLNKHEVYLGKRIKRGLFRSNSGLTINADVNGSYNILRKVVHEFKWIEGLSVNPFKINF